ncbi:probable serine/threonine-protein kinase tsuA isoform X1 [Nilaparvata lugens]|uniref:probable serine/threonine-protein kinase tsuA isoform X1 n=1 Tax=Nilaparvata lugens TaxID=108931 RepID=UPI000B98631B|nr:probable serine/threonine-protein kinase tsuA isoform X1 [Nilaparvata lugens]
MVASLQSRKEALESLLREKNEELKTLCIQEAELTGVLPPETPIEPGESPPAFRRRVGTAFTLPENLINKLKSKEEESLAALELEIKIQNGIAEAALGLASDSAASKSVRRKHRLMYQQSQRRLTELDARLTLLRQANHTKGQLKQRKKPRPPLDSDGDCCDGPESGSGSQNQLSTISNPDRRILRQNSNTYNNSRYYEGHQQNTHNIQTRMPGRPHTTSICSWQPSPDMRAPTAEHGYLPTNDGMWYNTAPNPSKSHHSNSGHGYSSTEDDRSVCNLRYRSQHRFGSLDRRRANTSSASSWHVEGEGSESQQKMYSPQPNPIIPAILLPNQTYPENSLMRTQSLAMVDNSLGRKTREKEWYETALDNNGGFGAAPVPVMAPTPSPPPPPLPPSSSSSTTFAHNNPVQSDHHQQHFHQVPPPAVNVSPSHNLLKKELSVSSLEQTDVTFHTVVPYESPKNHMVVEAGKWQPYREVTKPFEMADFYKYSTKFRKNAANNNNNSNVVINITSSRAPNPKPNNINENNTDNSSQQKCIYQPLQPMTCQPLAQNPSQSYTPPPTVHRDQPTPSEVLSWYQDQNTPQQSRSATLV